MNPDIRIVTAETVVWSTSEKSRLFTDGAVSYKCMTSGKKTKRIQGLRYISIFTVKVVFLHVYVILSTGGGGLPQCMLGYHPSGSRYPPPPGRHPPKQVPPLGAGLPRAVHAGRYGQRAGGMHPTGMQSCQIVNFTARYKLFNSTQQIKLIEVQNNKFLEVWIVFLFLECGI